MRQSEYSILPVDIPYRELPLPIGISFYTFQAMSHMYRHVYGEREAAEEYFILCGFMSRMFPQLIAGPIVRYADIEEQLQDRRSYAAISWDRGALYFIQRSGEESAASPISIGSVFEEVTSVPAGESIRVLTAWLGVFSYAFPDLF